MAEGDDPLADARPIQMKVRCCEHGVIWFDVHADGVCVTSLGFNVEEAMEVSDNLVEELEKAVAMRVANAGAVGRA